MSPEIEVIDQRIATIRASVAEIDAFTPPQPPPVYGLLPPLAVAVRGRGAGQRALAAAAVVAAGAVVAELAVAGQEVAQHPAAAQPQAQTATQHEYPALLPDDFQRQLVTALSEDPSWQELVASVLAADESTEARRRRGDPLYDVVASLDPTLRAELLDTVRATFRASQGEAELN